MPDTDKILSQHEVDALLSAIDSGGGETAGETAAEPYDFRRPSRIPPAQLQFLQSLFEGYARSLQSALSGLLLRTAEVRLTGIHQLPLNEFLESQPRPTILVLASAEPLDGPFLLAVNPLIGYPILERMLGAGKISPPQRDRLLSPLEWNVAETFVSRALEVLREAWAPVTAILFKILRRESDPGALRFDNPNEPTVVISIEIGLGEQQGPFEIALPAMAIESHLPKMTATTAFSGKKKEGGGGPDPMMSRGLGPAEVELQAHLPVETLSMQALEGLRPGDILLMNHPQAAPVVVTVEGRQKFLARLGCLRDRKAVKVAAMAPQRDVSSAASGRTALSVLKGEGDPASPESSAAPPGYVEHLLQLPLTASVVLAEKSMKLREVVGFKLGELIEFARGVEEPLELRAARRPIAFGKCVRVDDAFGLRITSIRGPRERVKALGP